MPLKTILLGMVVFLGSLIIVIAIYGLFAIYKRSAIISPIFKLLATVLLLAVLVQASISLLNTFIFLNGYVARLAGTTLYIVIFIITLLNIQILEIFSVLNEKITPKLILKVRIFAILWHMMLLLPNYASLFYGDNLPNWINLTSPYGVTLYILSSVVYDNSQ
ncbi:hypothetical protein HDV06_003801, partial [Boothiomyces sp. JEL0866]